MTAEARSSIDQWVGPEDSVDSALIRSRTHEKEYVRMDRAGGGGGPDGAVYRDVESQWLRRFPAPLLPLSHIPLSRYSTSSTEKLDWHPKPCRTRRTRRLNTTLILLPC